MVELDPRRADQMIRLCRTPKKVFINPSGEAGLVKGLSEMILVMNLPRVQRRALSLENGDESSAISTKILIRTGGLISHGISGIRPRRVSLRGNLVQVPHRVQGNVQKLPGVTHEVSKSGQREKLHRLYSSFPWHLRSKLEKVKNLKALLT